MPVILGVLGIRSRSFQKSDCVSKMALSEMGIAHRHLYCGLEGEEGLEFMGFPAIAACWWYPAEPGDGRGDCFGRSFLFAPDRSFALCSVTKNTTLRRAFLLTVRKF